MGGRGGPLWRRLLFRLDLAAAAAAGGARSWSAHVGNEPAGDVVAAAGAPPRGGAGALGCPTGVAELCDAHGEAAPPLRCRMFALLEAVGRCAALRPDDDVAAALPFDFLGGLVVRPPPPGAAASTALRTLPAYA